MPTSKLTRRRFLQSATASAALAAVAGRARAKSPAKRPNLLVIITDQQSATMLSCTGNRWLKTPAMDGLAAAGTRFELAYATNPVCLPARISFLTGLYPSVCGVRHNGTRPTKNVAELPAKAMGWLFRKAGYETAYGGKVHLPGPMRDVRTCGFDVITRNERDGLADACAAFLAKRRDKPFLLVASFINPHDICYMAIRDHNAASGLGRNAPAPMLEAMKLPAGVAEKDFYARLCPPLPANFEPPAGEPEAITQLLDLRPFRMAARKNWTAQRWRLHRWAYCRLTEKVDGQIARVLAAMKKADLEDDTVVIFTSDHGDMDAAHRMEHKTVFYEEAARVPMIVAHKGRTKAGSVDKEHLVSSGADLLPTLCDYAGIDRPADLPGLSVRALAEGKQPKRWRDDLLVEGEIGYMVTTGRYKYSLFDKGARREMLVDLQTDPGEMKNLAGEPACAKVLAEHRRRLAKHLQRTGMPFGVPS